MKSVLEQQMPDAASNPRDLRKEPRRKAKGSVSVRTARGEIQGQLVDVSDSGFRMSHAETSLEPGQVLEFAHNEAYGNARVIWNRIIGGRVESGFLIVERG